MKKEIVDDLRYSLDPCAFAREICKKDPDPWQSSLLMGSSKRVLLNCCRQSGKSTTSAILALHRAIFYPNSTVILVSRSQRQSDLLFQKVTEFYKMVPGQPKLPEDNKRSMKMRNGSWIVSVPGTEETIRGYSAVDLLIEDEASRVSDALYYSVRPMLAVSNGKFILMSTPYGKRGHFFDEWTGSNSWTRIEMPASSCPRISPEFLEEERRSLGEWWYNQEYCCEFGDTIDQLFRYDDIVGAISDELQPLIIRDFAQVSSDDEEDVAPLIVN